MIECERMQAKTGNIWNFIDCWWIFWVKIKKNFNGINSSVWSFGKVVFTVFFNSIILSKPKIPNILHLKWLK
jgi:hypothetical protein